MVHWRGAGAPHKAATCTRRARPSRRRAALAFDRAAARLFRASRSICCPKARAERQRLEGEARRRARERGAWGRRRRGLPPRDRGGDGGRAARSPTPRGRSAPAERAHRRGAGDAANGLARGGDEAPPFAGARARDAALCAERGSGCAASASASATSSQVAAGGAHADRYLLVGGGGPGDGRHDPRGGLSVAQPPARARRGGAVPSRAGAGDGGGLHLQRRRAVAQALHGALRARRRHGQEGGAPPHAGAHESASRCSGNADYFEGSVEAARESSATGRRRSSAIAARGSPGR